jgi:hypothetical protein
VAVGIAVATAGPAWADNLNVAGSWKMVQDNGYTVNLNISSQDPVTGHLTGTASTRGMTSNHVTGTETDHSIDLNIPWDTGPIGDCHGENTKNSYALSGGYFRGIPRMRRARQLPNGGATESLSRFWASE